MLGLIQDAGYANRILQKPASSMLFKRNLLICQKCRELTIKIAQNGFELDLIT